MLLPRLAPQLASRVLLRAPSSPAFLLSTMATSSSPASPASPTPIEDAIREKVTTALAPTRLEIHNDSRLHAHHAAMRGATSRETHFRLVVASARFRGLAQPRRHRILYALLADELKAEGGIHALQLRTLTPEEDQARAAKEEAAGEKVEEEETAVSSADEASPRGEEDEGGAERAEGKNSG